MRSARRNGGPRGARAGFTLVELMVALVAGMVAITAIYYVSSGSARHFQDQQRIAQTQTSLRMAMDQLRADIMRAGFFGTPNSHRANPPNLRSCPTFNRRIQAVELADNAGLSAFDGDFDNNPGIEFDTLRLTGNYATAGAYFAIGATSSTEVRLQTTWQGFRRDFLIDDGSGNAIVSTELLNAAFLGNPAVANDRMMHLRTLQGTSVFSPLSAVTVNSTTDPGDVRISVTLPIPIGTECVAGLGDGATIAPLSRVEYAVVDPRDGDAELAPFVGDEAALENAKGTRPAILVRRELQFDTDTVVPGSTRVVLEYIAHLDFQFVFDLNGNDTTLPPDLQIREDAAAEALLGDPTTSDVEGSTGDSVGPELLRSVIVTLAARTAGSTPQFDGDPTQFQRFEPHPNAVGNSRVRTIQAEIFLPNQVPSPGS